MNEYVYINTLMNVISFFFWSFYYVFNYKKEKKKKGKQNIHSENEKKKIHFKGK